MTTPKFKVGDKVRVKTRTALANHYPFTFTDSMAEITGEVFTIVNFYSDRYDIQNYEHFSDQLDPGDGYRYDLDGKAVYFSWSSPMLEKVDDEPVDTFKHYPGFVDPSFSHALATEALKAEIDKRVLDCIAIPKSDTVGLTSPWGRADTLADTSSHIIKADMAMEEPSPDIRPQARPHHRHHHKLNYAL